jgi:hypothetical protein
MNFYFKQKTSTSTSFLFILRAHLYRVMINKLVMRRIEKNVCVFDSPYVIFYTQTRMKKRWIDCYMLFYRGRKRKEE